MAVITEKTSDRVLATGTVPVPPADPTPDYRAHLEGQGFDEEAILAITRGNNLSELKHGPAAAAEILDLVLQLTGHKFKFVRWTGQGTMLIRSPLGRGAVICGSWYESRYVMRSLLTYVRKSERWDWLCNGQPNVNCKSLVHWGESVQISFPEFEEVRQASMHHMFKPRVQHS